MFDIRIEALLGEHAAGLLPSGPVRAMRRHGDAAANCIRNIADMFKLRHRVYIAEIDVESAPDLAGRRHQVEAIPQISIDPAGSFRCLWTKERVTPTSEQQSQRRIFRSWCGSNRSTAWKRDHSRNRNTVFRFRLIYQSHERTLTDAEVEEFDQQILEPVENSDWARN